tara:strand:+ start:335 stop:913 length:579 start_codon:yes stop_codon:yes gene_type:complete
MTEEIWKKVSDYEHLTDEQNKYFTSLFQISSHGRVWNNFRNTFKKTSINTRGYEILNWSIPKNMGLGINGQKGICYRVHRMVAKSFIENPENKPDINHIDGNKLNNTVDNIEWCTKAENARHSRDVLKSACYDKGHESIFSVLTEQERNYVIANYKPKDKKYGARAMSRELGVTHHTILKVLNRLGKGKTIC